ncbi:MAG TPA: flagellar protein FlgN [Opitutaceae bacterium]
MTPSWETIADLLRAELADYGGLLNRFEDQQQSLLARDAAAVLHHTTEIEDHVRALSYSRERRETAVAALAVSLGHPMSATLRSLLPQLEPAATPLLEALIDEVNRLLHRVRRTSRHNQTLLQRSLEVQQDVLLRLRPQSFTKTYAPNGRVAVASAAAPAGSLQVAG